MHVSNYFKNSMMYDIKNRKRRFGCEKNNSNQKIGYQFMHNTIIYKYLPYQRRQSTCIYFIIFKKKKY